ncbi:hypothetical protein [Streptomyces sp. NPDC056600]|uniref:hypothetical protein n=1 Tax=Streptomyces sp. NPDC056600 TaxID=3345874 RepID=UPI00368A862F
MPEVVAVSVDGRHLCATTVEDDDHWVVVHDRGGTSCAPCVGPRDRPPRSAPLDVAGPAPIATHAGKIGKAIP